MPKRTNTPNENPLFRAVRTGDKRAMVRALARVQEVNQRGVGGNTPLMLAAGKNQLAMARYLLARGADLSLRNKGSDTALHFAAARQNSAMVGLLLAHGADVNATDYRGLTPLERSMARSLACVTRLLERPPDQAACVRAFKQSLFRGDQKIITVLLDHCTRGGMVAWAGTEYLCHAATYGRLAAVKLLVERGASEEACKAAAAAAADGGHRAIVRYLEQAKPLSAKIVDRMKMRWRMFSMPLDIWLREAAVFANAPLVLAMLEKGADPNRADAEGRTPIHWAAGGESWAAVKALLDAGALIEVQDGNGWGPLHWAARSGSAAVVAGLLRRGADVNVVEHASRKRMPLHLACIRKDPTVAALLIAGGANIEALSEGKETPLHWAACGNCPRVVRLLIEKGARVNMQNRVGVKSSRTALHVAAEWGYTAVVEALIAGGAALNALDYYGSTPLDLAWKYRHRNVARLLEQAGARPGTREDED